MIESVDMINMIGFQKVLNWISHVFNTTNIDRSYEILISFFVDSYRIKLLQDRIEMNIDYISNFFSDPDYVNIKISSLMPGYLEILDDIYNDCENMFNTYTDMLIRMIVRYYCVLWMIRSSSEWTNSRFLIKRYFIHICTSAQTLATLYNDYIEHFYFEFDSDLSCVLDEHYPLDVKNRAMFTRMKISVMCKWYDEFKRAQDEHYSTSFHKYFGKLINGCIYYYHDYNKNIEDLVKTFAEVTCLGSYSDIIDCILKYSYI